VTKVQVLSSPQLMVLNNSTAQLQVGSLVPYLTSTSQSTLTSEAPVINTVQYQPTGVIMNVTPRVNQDGLVMLKISQNVSSVDTTAPTSSGINSPTFLQRSITTSVVVQDGQTVGLAGLISDNASTGNSGIPFLKDIPILGVLAGTQNNTRARTELLVLITPYVVYNQQDARALTQDLLQSLPNAAAVPYVLTRPPEGNDDPNSPYRPSIR
jgi:general secretion pathway protein D